MTGGHQEKDKRAGTENVAGIVALGKACEIAKRDMGKNIEYLRTLRDYFIKLVEEKIDIAMFNGSRKLRVSGNSNFSFKGIDSQSLLLKLDEKGICVSSGSACSEGNGKPSHVLKAIGLSDEEAKSAIRVTLGEENTKEDIDYLVDILEETIKKLRIQN